MNSFSAVLQHDNPRSMQPFFDGGRWPCAAVARCVGVMSSLAIVMVMVIGVAAAGAVVVMRAMEVGCRSLHCSSSTQHSARLVELAPPRKYRCFSSNFSDRRINMIPTSARQFEVKSFTVVF
jgi:hypothetical protein